MKNNLSADKVKFGLVGVGGYAGKYLNVLEILNNEGLAELCAVIIRDKKKYPEIVKKLRSEQIAIYPDLESLFNSDTQKSLDVIAIPTAIHFHAPMAIQCLRQGYNVLLEKPLAPTVQEVDEIVKEENKARKFCAVGYQHIYSKSIKDLKKRICDGELGDIKSLKCYGIGGRGDQYYSRNSWAGMLKSDGQWILDSPHNNAFAHYINIMCFLASPQNNISASPQAVLAELYQANQIESADTVCLRMETKEGVDIFFVGSHCVEKQGGIRIIIETEKGTVVWQPGQAEISYIEGKKECLSDEGLDPSVEMFKTVCELSKNPASKYYCSLDIARAQTLCINGSFESSDITSIGKGHIKRKEERGDIKTVVIGIDKIIEQSFEDKKLFSEMAVQWARKGQWIDLKNYTHFPSFKKM